MLEGCRGKERLFRWLRIRLVFGACASFMEFGDRPPSGIAREDRAPEAENALRVIATESIKSEGKVIQYDGDDWGRVRRICLNLEI